MGLSEQEQRMLDEIESALYAEDPKFGSTMSGRSGGFDDDAPRRGFNIQVVALLVLGLLMLIGGVALNIAMENLWLISISVAGFLLMFGACVWALMPDSSSSKKGMSFSGASGAGSSSRTNKNQGQRKSKPSSSRLEDRFRNRFD